MERADDSRVRLACEQTDFTVVVTIGCHSFTQPVVSMGLQQRLQHFFKWRPNGALYIERFARFMSECTQRGDAACKNAWLRIN